MITKWPTDKDRIREYMHISSKKKMEWLYQMSRFMYKMSLFKNASLYKEPINE
ncbi:MAG: hypothetical protein RAP41_07935 [Candidatus Orphnella occulta]|nr:hypothetical protein [Candidatus Orphnella occulta]